MTYNDVFPVVVREIMGPDGRPVPGGRIFVRLDTGDGPVALALSTDALCKLYAMLDPWARAMAAQQAGHAGEVKRG